MVLFFSITMIPSTLLMQRNHIWREKQPNHGLASTESRPEYYINISHYGNHLDREMNKGQAKSKEELWEVLKEA